jgi:signal peptidase I
MDAGADGPIPEREGAEVPPEPSGPAPAPGWPLRRLVTVLSALAFFLALLLFVRTWVLIPFRIPTSSMEPALLGQKGDRPGDTIIVNRLAYLFSDPARWDIVAFRPAPGDGGGEGAAGRKSEGDSNMVKRVVGLPGETVRVQDGWVLIDGRPLPRIPSLASIRYVAAGEHGASPSTSVKLGPEEYFVLGDNSYLSHDSRRFGPLPRTNIFGRVEWIVLPPSRFGRVQ